MLAALVAKYAGRADLTPQTTLEELGLSSLERVELMVALEDAFETRIDEGAFSEARDVGQLRQLVERAETRDVPPAEPVEFPTWTRSWPARFVRRVNLPLWDPSWGLQPLGRYGWLASFLFVTAAAMRLARFNIQSGMGGDKRLFAGMPTRPPLA